MTTIATPASKRRALPGDRVKVRFNLAARSLRIPSSSLSCETHCNPTLLAMNTRRYAPMKKDPTALGLYENMAEHSEETGAA